MPILSGGTKADDLGLLEDEGGLGISILPAFFGVSFECFEVGPPFLLEFLSLILLLLLELRDDTLY